jgi:hypothetical protein
MVVVAVGVQVGSGWMKGEDCNGRVQRQKVDLHVYKP